MKRRRRIAGLSLVLLAALTLVAILWPSPDDKAEAAPALSTPGSLNVVVAPGEKLRTCPLEHTEVEGWIVGDIAHVRVTQRFGNPYDDPIEAVYVFPLPENSAVNDMLMQIGRRTIRGVIKEREEAKQIYEEAKQAGKTASLLEQERPNIFTQSVANILPGDAIEITIWYVQDLRYQRGRYEFVFPMVVGPRYIPGGALPGADTGGGWAPDTDQVPDASRITPPVLRPEERTGHDISLTLHLDAGIPAHDPVCKSHDIVVDSYGGTPMVISLASHETVPNRDFSFSWRVAGERSEVGLLTHRDERSGYFMLILQPKANFDPAEITPKEMVFCLDTSGSMSGLPIEKSKEVVKLCLQEMGPDDTFQVIRFAGDSSTFAPEPVRATQANIAQALEFIERLQGGGGTEMLQGIQASLAFPADPARLRIVAFLTDGYIGNESAILSRIEEKLGPARIFSFGIGSSVNRYLLVKMAQMGRGAAQFVRQDEDPDAAVRTFVDRICRPYLTDIEIDWGGLDVMDCYPAYVPDLFADQPVILHGRYGLAGEGMVTIRGLVAGEPWETAVRAVLPPDRPQNDALAILWARAAIEDMMDQMHGGEAGELVSAITELALAYRLMSPYTSFVAVEEKVVNREGKLVTVQVPVPMPEGVSYEGVFGDARGEVAASRQPLVSGAGAGGLGAGALARAPAGPPATAAQAGSWAMGEMEADRPFRDVSQAWLIAVAPEVDQSLTRALTNLRGAAQTAIALPVGSIAAISAAQAEQIGESERLTVLLLTGSKPVALSEETRESLAGFLRAGGFLIVDSGSNDFYESIVPSLSRLLPEGRTTDIPTDHAVFQGGSMPFALPGGCPVGAAPGRPGPAQGIFLGDRLAVFVTRGHLSRVWGEPMSDGSRQPYEMGVNLIAYALQNAG